MHSKEAIERTIRLAIKDVTGITELKINESLIDREMGIIPANFLYIFDILEKKLQLPTYDIFNHTFEVMTVENLTNSLFELGNRGYAEEAS